MNEQKDRKTPEPARSAPSFVTFPYIDVSTRHVTRDTMDFLKANEALGNVLPAIATYESGAWVSVPSRDDADPSVPADLHEILQVAREEGVSTVRLDEGGKEYQRLKCFAAHTETERM